ncbi:MAG: diguanylate cyclase (GGDEF)-like protein [Sulfurimonas sp.]|uniref:GGDEF domain-containing protein n=1 Tax=Sulfurimonas sp. TaxID=2022749 RepID=UPI0039E667F9
MISTGFILSTFDLTEVFYQFSREQEEYDLDEIILTLAISSIYLSIFILRRFMELKAALIKANTDPLIGIFNRRKGSEYIVEVIGNLKYKNTNASIIMFDIDDFKKVNDNHGHDIGDYVLKKTIAILENIIRDGDILIRWGGEEFIALCPNTDLAGSSLLAERFRKSIEEYDFDKVRKVTASFGVIELNASNNLREQIVKVDGNLYKSKHNGKNQVFAG